MILCGIVQSINNKQPQNILYYSTNELGNIDSDLQAYCNITYNATTAATSGFDTSSWKSLSGSIVMSEENTYEYVTAITMTPAQWNVFLKNWKRKIMFYCI